MGLRTSKNLETRKADSRGMDFTKPRARAEWIIFPDKISARKKNRLIYKDLYIVTRSLYIAFPLWECIDKGSDDDCLEECYALGGESWWRQHLWNVS
jgi:hypothetical protein